MNARPLPVTASARRHSPRVERAAAAIRRVLAGVAVDYPDGGMLMLKARLHQAGVDVDALVESMLVALLPELWCSNSCPELGLDGHGARRSGGGA